MSDELSTILQDALELDPLSRAKLMDALYTSLESAGVRAREIAWAETAERRTDEYESGRLGSVPWEQIKDDARNRK